MGDHISLSDALLGITQLFTKTKCEHNEQRVHATRAQQRASEHPILYLVVVGINSETPVGIYFKIHCRIYSDVRCGIYRYNFSGILFDIYSDSPSAFLFIMLSGILS